MATYTERIKSSKNPHQTLYRILTELTRSESDITKLSRIAYVLETLRSGGYHKFLSTFVNPKRELIHDLKAIGLSDISKLVTMKLLNEARDTNWCNESTPKL